MSVLRQALLVLPLLLSLGCPPGDSGKLDDTAPGSVDADGDGYASSEDCDDSDPTIYPGAEETCDGEDNDCDGEVDETGTNTFYADTDGDGFGNPTSTVEDCQPPTGYVEDDSDCNDQDAEQHPGAEEYCNGEDDDWDDDIDEEAVDPATWYQDADGDGWGNEEVTAEACDQPTGHTEQAEDCDDEDADQHPGADEYCNGEDDDCDGEVDEDTIDAETTWYADDDEDGYGDSGDVIVQCTQPSGYVLNAEDCNDDDSSFSPAATEYCDGVTDPTGSDGNLGANPAFTAYTDDGDNTNDDLSLGATSVCIDAGNPSEEHRGQHFAEYGTVGVMSTMPDPFRGAHEWSYPAFVDLIGHVVSAASAPPAPQPPPRIARMTPTAGRMGPGRAVFQQETSSVFVDGAFEGIRAE